MNNAVLYDWSIDSMLEVELYLPDNFLKIKETLTRIGISSKKEKKLYQTAHILHKQGKYYIVHFKELFLLDGKNSSLSVEDIDRRNAIAKILEDWKLLKISKPFEIEVKSVISQLKILPFKEKVDWELVPKYNIGQHKQINKVVNYV
jgi:hypothetical protein